MTLTCSTQMPHMLRTGIADCLGMPERELRVVAPDVGGGFGQKMSLIPEYVFLVWAARKFGGSLAWIEDRRENLTASFHSRDQRHIVRGAFAADGRLLAVEADIRCNVGAYSCYPVTCGVEPLMAMAEFPGPYDVREYKVRSRGVTTNTCPMAPYRGVSRPAITLSMERLMDCAAARLGIDPVEIRRRNLVAAFPYKTVTGLTYDEGSYRAVARPRRGDHRHRRLPRAPAGGARAEGRYIGVGFSVFNERSGYGTPAFAARSMDITPGYERVEIAMDPVRPCRGPDRRLAAWPGAAAGAPPAHRRRARHRRRTTIHVIHGDTDATPYGWGTFASRSMVICGGACKLAAEKLAAKLRVIAATLLQADGDSDRARRRRGAGRRRRRRRSRSPSWRGPPITRAIASGTTPTPASWPSPPTIRRAPIPTPATRRWSRSMSRPAACGSSASSPSRMPACSSTR